VEDSDWDQGGRYKEARELPDGRNESPGPLRSRSDDEAKEVRHDNVEFQ